MAATPTPRYTGYGDNMEIDNSAEREAAAKAQADYTAKHAMSREDFIKKYAIGEGGTFVANDKGGNAASEVAGQNVGEYYDKYLGKDAKKTTTVSHGWDNDPTEETIDWGAGKYSRTHPNFDGYDNVNPHPESERGNGWDEAWKQVRPFAAMAAMAYGGWALSGAGAAGAAGAAAATPATGLAGTLGMNAGIGATALNAGALNTGISLVQGKNIGDSLKSGVMAAALSPVGGWAKGAIGEATAGLGKGISNAIASTAAGAATGAAGAALTGKDIGKGATTGLIAGGIQSFGNAVGGWAKQETGSDLVGMAASAGTKAVLGKKQNNLSLLGSLVDGGIEAFGKRTKSGVKLSDGTTV